MEPPASRQTRAMFMAVINAHVQKRYNQLGTECECKKCGSVIKQAPCHVSVHNNSLKECAGSGKVIYIPLPYCPVCEGLPQKLRSCVHE